MSNHSLSRCWPAMLLAGALGVSLYFTARTTHAAEDEIYTYFALRNSATVSVMETASIGTPKAGWRRLQQTLVQDRGRAGQRQRARKCRSTIAVQPFDRGFLDLQAGLRYDFKPEPERGFAVIGVEGLAPYWFEIDASAFQ